MSASGAHIYWCDHWSTVSDQPHSRLANARETKAVLERFGLFTKHRLGQNFLVSDEVIGHICELAELGPEDVVLEVGPGIGTLTFVDPETGLFGTLGHGVNDVDTAVLLELQSGAITPASVAGVVKGEDGRPGELRGAFPGEEDLGTLFANTEQGVFGYLTDKSGLTGTPVPVAAPDQVHPGPATILANVSGTQVEEYDVEILKVFDHPADARDLMLKVTDKALLEKTGGIVQGMSGSPILQDGRLAGAVTHVLIDHADRGYGILATHMIERAEAG